MRAWWRRSGRSSSGDPTGPAPRSGPKAATRTAPVLDADKHLVSDLWLDQPDAHERIDERLAHGEITETDAVALRQFTDDGFLRLSLDLDDAFYGRFQQSIEQQWVDRPPDLAVAPQAGDRVSIADVEDRNRSIGYRIVDLHSHAGPAQELYLEPQIFRFVELIFGQPAVSFQSLYFEFGSEQALHRDPMFVATKPPSHLVASWTALEDITSDSGPLLYVPGSHRLPWFEFIEGEVAVGDKGAIQKRKEWAEHRVEILAERGLSPVELTCNQGDTFIWHGGLLHGGKKVTNPDSTRKSYVVHYSTAVNYTSRHATMGKKVTGADGTVDLRKVGATTGRMLERDGCAGIDNPLRELDRSALV